MTQFHWYTARVTETGDILSLNTFPMFAGYYTALEQTLFVESVDEASLKVWEANVAAHEYGMSLLKPGARCSEVTEKISAFLPNATCYTVEHLVMAIRLVSYHTITGVRPG